MSECALNLLRRTLANDELPRNNYTYYRNDFSYYPDGFNGEDEIVFTMVSEPKKVAVHVWMGYMQDILKRYEKAGTRFRRGLTRDYYQMDNAFSKATGNTATVNPDIYIDELMHYVGLTFDHVVTSDVLRLIISLFAYAEQHGSLVRIDVN